MRARRDDGAAVVDFVLVSVLLLTLFLLVVQLAVVLHARTVLVAGAAEGARYGAAADRTPAEAAQRAHDAVASALSRSLADRLSFQAREVDLDGVVAVEVTVSGPMPVVLLPAGPLTLTVRGHAQEEARP